MFNNSFDKKLGLIQYNTALAITGAVRGSFRKNCYQKLDFDSLQQQRRYSKLCLIFKITKNQSPKYLF